MAIGARTKSGRIGSTRGRFTGFGLQLRVGQARILISNGATYRGRLDITLADLAATDDMTLLRHSRLGRALLQSLLS
jgi:hypothetical protein